MKSSLLLSSALRVTAAAAMILFSAGCGKKEKELPRVATAADLVGTWKADFAATWPLSKEAFLTDTMRGSSAYSKDPAEKEAQVKKEMEEFVGGIVQTYLPDGKMKQHLMKRESDGDYKVTAIEGSKLTVEQTAGRKQTVAVTFTAEDEMHWQPAGKSPVTIVFRRQP
jgi:hypothetical protein